MFARLGPGDKNIFTRLGERKRGVHSQLGPEDAPRHMRVSRKRSTSRLAKTPSQRRKDDRELIRSYVTCSSKCQQEIEEEYNTADRASQFRGPKEDPHAGQRKNICWHRRSGRSPKNLPSSDKDRVVGHAHLVTTRNKKYIKDPVEIHHIKQREGESTKAFMKRFKAKSMHASGAPECMRISGFIHGITNPNLIKKLNDNIPKAVDEMMSVTIAFLRGEVAVANQSKKKVPPTWKHHETGHMPNFDKRLDFKSQHKWSRWSPSPYNGIIGRPSLRKIQAVPSTAHRMLNFPVEGGITAIRSSTVMPAECRMITEAHDTSLPKELMAAERIKVAVHPEYPEQSVTIGGSLSEKGRMDLSNLLKENLDIFAWKPADMTGVTRFKAEHHLNVREGCQPIRKKRRGHAPDRNKAIQKKVAKLVEAEIMREVHYHDWLSNPVMVRSTTTVGGCA
nr:reverse transcriptase domain-containing protein [Tanacetum cinerariifolium]